MAIRYYDEALYNKIQKWMKNPNARILKPEETTRLFQNISDVTGDKPITLPLVALSRDKTFSILHTGKQPLSHDGMTMTQVENGGVKLNAIPISLSYQLDIYTKKYEEGDEYLRNFIFNLINHPALQIEIPYNDLKFTHNAYVRVLTDVEDNSDIKEKLFPDQFTRWTIKLTIDDAYLFSAPVVDNVTIESVGLDVDSITTEKELVVDESTQILP